MLKNNICSSPRFLVGSKGYHKSKKTYLLNVELTPNRYHLPVQIFGQKAIRNRQGEKPSIGLAFVIAFGFHVLILILPLTGKTPLSENTSVQIEVQLTTFNTPSLPPQTETVLPEPSPEPKQAPEPEPEPRPEPLNSMVESKPDIEPVEPEPAEPMPLPQIAELRRDLDSMTEIERSRLTSTILVRQFITEESAADKIFGRPFELNSTAPKKDFHYPIRPDLLVMLDQPMQELPFAYTPGLVNFAYDPGVKGDLQRFWDVITPEFGWRTRYGTEVRCIWILVIVGCGWK